jgi:N-acyl homoserine lactone hydrolase
VPQDDSGIPIGREVSITPLPTGLITIPGRKIDKYPGLTVVSPIVVCAYLIRTPQSTVLLDTGIETNQEGIDWYAPRVFPIMDQLGLAGIDRGSIDLIVNCHLHCDHAGGNHLFPRTPIIVQAREVTAAQAADYTVREACFDYPDAELVEIDGPHRIDPWVTVLPTPGHSPGHQSLIVDGTANGRVLLAGQAFDTAAELGWAVLARQVGAEYADAEAPGWVDDIIHSDIDVARFAHDMSQWRPDSCAFTGARPLEVWPDNG